MSLQTLKTDEFHVDRRGSSSYSYKFTFLTPKSYARPDSGVDHNDSNVDEFVRHFLGRAEKDFHMPCDLVDEPSVAYIDGFDAFEERFLRHSEYSVILVSPKSSRCLQLFYPRLFVFLQSRPEWSNRFLLVYLGPVVMKKPFDLDVFALDPIEFPSEHWRNAEEAWNQMFNLLKMEWIPYDGTSRRTSILPESSILSTTQNEEIKKTEALLENTIAALAAHKEDAPVTVSESLSCETQRTFECVELSMKANLEVSIETHSLSSVDISKQEVSNNEVISTETLQVSSTTHVSTVPNVNVASEFNESKVVIDDCSTNAIPNELDEVTLYYDLVHEGGHKCHSKNTGCIAEMLNYKKHAINNTISEACSWTEVVPSRNLDLDLSVEADGNDHLPLLEFEIVSPRVRLQKTEDFGFELIDIETIGGTIQEKFEDATEIPSGETEWTQSMYMEDTCKVIPHFNVSLKTEDASDVVEETDSLMEHMHCSDQQKDAELPSQDNLREETISETETTKVITEEVRWYSHSITQSVLIKDDTIKSKDTDEINLSGLQPLDTVESFTHWIPPKVSEPLNSTDDLIEQYNQDVSKAYADNALQAYEFIQDESKTEDLPSIATQEIQEESKSDKSNVSCDQVIEIEFNVEDVIQEHKKNPEAVLHFIDGDNRESEAEVKEDLPGDLEESETDLDVEFQLHAEIGKSTKSGKINVGVTEMAKYITTSVINVAAHAVEKSEVAFSNEGEKLDNPDSQIIISEEKDIASITLTTDVQEAIDTKTCIAVIDESRPLEERTDLVEDSSTEIKLTVDTADDSSKTDVHLGTHVDETTIVESQTTLVDADEVEVLQEQKIEEIIKKIITKEDEVNTIEEADIKQQILEDIHFGTDNIDISKTETQINIQLQVQSLKHVTIESPAVDSDSTLNEHTTETLDKTQEDTENHLKEYDTIQVKPVLNQESKVDTTETVESVEVESKTVVVEVIHLDEHHVTANTTQVNKDEPTTVDDANVLNEESVVTVEEESTTITVIPTSATSIEIVSTETVKDVVETTHSEKLQDKDTSSETVIDINVIVNVPKVETAKSVEPVEEAKVETTETVESVEKESQTITVITTSATSIKIVSTETVKDVVEAIHSEKLQEKEISLEIEKEEHTTVDDANVIVDEPKVDTTESLESVEEESKTITVITTSETSIKIVSTETVKDVVEAIHSEKLQEKEISLEVSKEEHTTVIDTNVILDEVKVETTESVESVDVAKVEATDSVESVEVTKVETTDSVESVEEVKVETTDSVESVEVTKVETTDSVESVEEVKVETTNSVESVEEVKVETTNSVESVEVTKVETTDSVQSVELANVETTDSVESVEEESKTVTVITTSETSIKIVSSETVKDIVEAIHSEELQEKEISLEIGKEEPTTVDDANVIVDEPKVETTESVDSVDEESKTVTVITTSATSSEIVCKETVKDVVEAIRSEELQEKEISLEVSKEEHTALIDTNVIPDEPKVETTESVESVEVAKVKTTEEVKLETTESDESVEETKVETTDSVESVEEESKTITVIATSETSIKIVSTETIKDVVESIHSEKLDEKEASLEIGEEERTTVFETNAAVEEPNDETTKSVERVDVNSKTVAVEIIHSDDYHVTENTTKVTKEEPTTIKDANVLDEESKVETTESVVTIEEESKTVTVITTSSTSTEIAITEIVKGVVETIHSEELHEKKNTTEVANEQLTAADDICVSGGEVTVLSSTSMNKEVDGTTVSKEIDETVKDKAEELNDLHERTGEYVANEIDTTLSIEVEEQSTNEVNSSHILISVKDALNSQLSKEVMEVTNVEDSDCKASTMSDYQSSEQIHIEWSDTVKLAESNEHIPLSELINQLTGSHENHQTHSLEDTNQKTVTEENQEVTRLKLENEETGEEVTHETSLTTTTISSEEIIIERKTTVYEIENSQTLETEVISLHFRTDLLSNEPSVVQKEGVEITACQEETQDRDFMQEADEDNASLTFETSNSMVQAVKVKCTKAAPTKVANPGASLQTKRLSVTYSANPCLILTPSSYSADSADVPAKKTGRRRNKKPDDLVKTFLRDLEKQMGSELFKDRCTIPEIKGEAFFEDLQEFQDHFLKHQSALIILVEKELARSFEVFFARIFVFLSFFPEWSSKILVVFLNDLLIAPKYDLDILTYSPIKYHTSSSEAIKTIMDFLRENK